MTMDAETIYECPHCQAEVDPAELGGRVYECQMDGLFVAEEGEGNRCPQCNKFAAKVADQSCPDCGEAIEDGELTEREVYRSADGTAWDTAEEAEAYDTPEAVAERADKAAAAKAREADWRADHQARTIARIQRLNAALDLPTTPPLGYYAEPWRGALIDSQTAEVTPAEWLACCGVGDYDAAAARYAELGLDPVDEFMVAHSNSFSIAVGDLCTLLEALGR